MIERTLEHWRELPHLRVKECATIAGISPREMENHMKDPSLSIRRIGKIRFVTTMSFRRWVGEDPESEANEPVISLSVRRKAKKLRGRLG